MDDDHLRSHRATLDGAKGEIMKRQEVLAVAALAAASLCGAALAGGPPTYRVIKLNVEPKSGDGNAEATAIAEGGGWWAYGAWLSVQIATGEGTFRAVSCDRENLCTDPFPELPTGGSATAVDINQLGEMIGVRQDPGQQPFGYAVLSGKAFTAFESLKYNCPEVKGFIPQAVSNNRYIYGNAPGCHGHIRPAYYHKGNLRIASGMENALPPGAMTVRYVDVMKGASGGAVIFKDGHTEAFHTYWFSQGVHFLGTLGGPNSVTRAVRWSYAVGCSDTAIPGEQKAFWAGGPTEQPMTALPPFGDGPTCATGVTTKPVIVGNGQKSTQVQPSTAFYYRDGVMYDINDLLQESDRKYHILRIAGITGAGNIAATAISDDDPHTVAVRLELVKE